MPRISGFLRPITFLVLACGSAVITLGSLAYFDGEEVAPFVIEKLPLPLEEVWLAALQAHVVAAAFALPACLLLLSKSLLRRAPRLHRWVGRTAGVVVLFALAPSGFYLSLFAKGGVLSTVGFMLSGAIVVGAMVEGVRTARAGDFRAHRRNMLHVVAQLSVAVTSRAMLFVLDAADVDPDRAYLLSLWLPVIASAGLVELLLPRTLPLSHTRRTHEPLARPHHDPLGQPGLGS